MGNIPYELTKFTGEFLGDIKRGVTAGPVITSSVGSVKDEFQPPCVSKYREVLNGLMYLKRFHNIELVLEELRKDLSI